METASEYELKRLENIRRNRKILASLQIPKPFSLQESPIVHEARSVRVDKDRSGNLAHVARTRRHSENAPLERRTSSRLRQKGNNETEERKLEQELYNLDSLHTLNPKTKPRAARRTAGQASFDPEEGFSQGFVSLVKTVSSRPVLPTKKADAEHPIVTVKNQACVLKAVPDRIYSVAFYPARENIVACCGSKYGYLSFWDATSSWQDAVADPLLKQKHFLFKPHDGSVSNLNFNPVNAAQLRSSSYDGTVKCMDLVKGVFEDLHACPRDGQQIITGLDSSSNGQVIYFADTDGCLLILDVRQAKQAKTFRLHTKKIGCISLGPINQHYLATASLENVVCVWDLRMIKPDDSQAITRLQYNRAITSVAFHPALYDCLVSNCYDDNVRIHKGILSSSPSEIAISHNNQTGRWITNFKAVWDIKSTLDYSSILIGNMNRGLDIIDGKSGSVRNFLSELVTGQPAVNCAHPQHDLVLSGTASGRMALWSGE